ncbi:tRNA (guanine-N(7)-)-methyltransferase [Balamuthia mandrillaris]
MMEAPSPAASGSPAHANEPVDAAHGKKRKKSYHRLRAHSNPLADKDIPYPICPDEVNWAAYYPAFFSPSTPSTHQVEFADVGCGFGGLTMALGRMFPDKLTMAMEIRERVVDFVQGRIVKLREEHAQEGLYQNVACVRINAMKHLPNYFRKGQLQKLFFLFPDPHFKKRKQRRRIITTTLLAEYAYVVAVGGLLYTNTDVEELHQWMVKHLSEHPLFERLSQEEMEQDPVLELIQTTSEEAQKVAKNEGKKYPAVFRRIARPE